MKKGLPLLLHSLLAGFTSACLDNVSLAHRSNYPLLPAYIQYGLKPFLFAVVSAGFNNVFFDQTVEIEQKIARIFIKFYHLMPLYTHLVPRLFVSGKSIPQDSNAFCASFLNFDIIRYLNL